MLTGCRRISLGDETKGESSPWSRSKTDAEIRAEVREGTIEALNKAFGSNPKYREVRKDFWSSLDPAVQTTAIVVAGLIAVRFVRAVL